MVQSKVEWLPHLSPEVMEDARGHELDAYAVALEGWRRGLTLRWHVKDSEKFADMKTWFVDKPGKLFSLSSNERTHYFFKTRGDKVTNEAVEIGADKEETKRYLEKAGVSVPQGKRLLEDASNEEIEDYASSIGFPIVLKPTDGSFGRGVMTNIQSAEELSEALTHVRSNLKYSDVIVERYIAGEEYRVYVVGDQVVAAVNRIPANVVGDGSSSIQSLIEQKNQLRELNPRLISCLIKVDSEMKNFISAQGLTLESIPKKGEKVFLTDKSNISIGGDPIDVLDELSVEVKDTAVRAVQAVPGLHHVAVDLIIEKDQPLETATVIIELNPTAQIGSLLFPMQGQARDVPAAIIDFYFPETKEIVTDKAKIYFDFPDIIEPLKTRSATVTTVSAAPVGNIYAKKYIVSGDVQGIDYHRGLRKRAFELKLSGFVRNLENDDIEVVVTGTNHENVDDFRKALFEDPERSDVQAVQEEPWDGPVKVGFEVKADLKTQVEQLRLMKQEMDLLEKEFKKVEREHRKYAKNFTWRMTLPFRKLADLFKYIARSFGG
ncbi:acylphosphatase [Alkalihalobacterium chitinilyticum]|uniref:Acylphosphatase n=1 Tax=Alkalihalobacterium chitinilyticum TaxID=2980103 RepID=A0ABT5VK53_9BACI|nr:acylphosphatase [Alkalihalobacterium chitinilyticum]MDE5415819.1 acylphosphatase [Alkalihalobacterium chitinilyticum]